MKVLFLALFLVTGSVALNALHGRHQNVNAEGPECPIDDPLDREGPYAINITLDPLIALDEGSVASKIHATGLSSLHYKIDLTLLNVKFEAQVPEIDGKAQYEASGYLDVRPLREETVPSGNLTGSGEASLSGRGIEAKGSLVLLVNIITNKVTITRLTLEVVNFDSLSVDLGTTMTIGGHPVDWAELSKNLKANFEKDLADHKAEIENKIRLAANNIIGQYTLEELVELIGGGNGGEC